MTIDKASRRYGYLDNGAVVPAFFVQQTALKGLKKSKGRPCIRRLAGLRCKITGISLSCDCVARFWDHTSLYLKDGQPYLLVTQPYEIDETGLADLLAMCKKYGLEICIRGASWYFPGATILIEITKFEVAK